MNEFISAIILAVIQAMTEWIPVSSSGHLVLFTKILDFDGGMGFDVALHLATLIAVVVYFWKDLFAIARDFVLIKTDSENWRLGWLIILATIPAGIVGFALRDMFRAAFESLEVVAIGLGITGLVLIIASLDYGVRGKSTTWWKALFMGCAQAVAIVPGISRSGSTIGTGLILGLNEKSALRFSFLMSIPVIFGAYILNHGDVTWDFQMIIAAIVAFAVGILTIHMLFRYILNKKDNLKWFGIYALLLAIGMGIYLLL